MYVKVDDQLSDPFCIGVGLWQGCVLFPQLFSLHINGLSDYLKQKQTLSDTIFILMHQ